MPRFDSLKNYSLICSFDAESAITASTSSSSMAASIFFVGFLTFTILLACLEIAFSIKFRTSRALAKLAERFSNRSLIQA